MIHIKVLFFATLRDAAGVAQSEMDVADGTTVDGLKSAIARRFPGTAAAIPHSLAAVNHEYEEGASILPDGAEVALFPPVSGGGRR